MVKEVLYDLGKVTEDTAEQSILQYTSLCKNSVYVLNVLYAQEQIFDSEGSSSAPSNGLAFVQS